MKLNQEQFRDYLKEVFLEKDRHPSWRKGQLYFNVLDRMFPACAGVICDTPDDPYYNDDVLPQFFVRIMSSEGS